MIVMLIAATLHLTILIAIALDDPSMFDTGGCL